jgi:peptide/nickel transport system ATP-binding protein
MRLEARDISFRYDRKGPWVLRHEELVVPAGGTVGLFGPSGCGKTTFGRILAGYLQPATGQVLVDGNPLPSRGYNPVQMVFQHPEKSVNPRWKLGRTLAESWQPDAELLEELCIDPTWLDRWPNELSAGELQRICLARVLGPRTRYIIADEMTTMLDPVTQALIWEVVRKRQFRSGFGLLVISHDASLLERICDEVHELGASSFAVTAREEAQAGAPDSTVATPR